MKKTFNLLAQLDLEVLNNLENPDDLKALQQFQKQLKKDFSNYIAPGTFDPIKQADNWLAQIRNLAIQGQTEINEESMKKLDRINQLHNGVGEIGFMTLDMYQAIQTVKLEVEGDETLGVVKNAIRDANIKSVIIEYKNHLTNKLGSEGLKIISDGGKELVDKEATLTSKQVRLIGRYQAIADLEKNFSTKTTLDEKDLKETVDVYNKCLANKPDWSERPFLQKLTDVLSLGFKPLYRAFVSKESELQNRLDNELKGPSLGG